MAGPGILRIIAALGVAASMACGAAPAADAESDGNDGLRGLVLPEPPARPDFTLTDTDGAPYDFRARTDSSLTLLFIGYTYCPDVCPVHLANLAAVLRDLPYGARQRIKVVFVTGDPERDTPERMRTWLDAFDPRFVGLRGSLDDVNAILAQLQLPGVVHSPPEADGSYTVGHPAHIIAFPPNGGPARAYYGFGTRQADWRHDLPMLLEDTAAVARTTADPPERERAASRALVPLPAGAGPAALYATVANPHPDADALTGASTRIAGRVTLHGYAHAGHGSGDEHASMAMMEPVDAIEIAPRDSVRLAPGSWHLMLEELAQPLAVGDTFTVELRFRSGRTLDFGAIVIPYAALETMMPAQEETH